jgi:hypothetical protein
VSGLNDGFELEGDKTQFVEGAEPLLEPFSVDGDAIDIVTLENRIIDLQDLADEIRDVDGMTQDFAMEALRILPDVLSASPKHFSKAPSMTRLKISMEEIEKGVWALIAAAVVAVIAIVYKIFKWLSGDKSSDGASGGGSGGAGAAATKAEGKLDENIRTAEATSKAVEGAAEAVHEGTQHLHSNPVSLTGAAVKGNKPGASGAGDDKPYTYNDFDQLIAKFLTDGNKFDHAKKFLESDDPIFHDIISAGEYSKMAADAGDALLSLQDVLDTKVKLLEEILREDIHSNEMVDEWKHNKALDNPALMEPIELKFRGNKVSMEEISRQLRTMKEKIQSKKAHERINFDKLFQRMHEVYKKPVNMNIFTSLKGSIRVVAKMEEKMASMQKLTDNLAHDGNAGSASAGGVAVRIRQVILTLGKDTYAYAILAHELKFYAMHSEYLAKEALGFGTEVVRKIVHAMRMDGQEVPKEWDKLLKDLDKQLHTLREAFRSGQS